ncbi:MAG TPA: helical backbone metal receptor [Candidatus Limnocylindria bacterium]|nr:helical backbone metal receptor [Candidatus Limnocylindria bacterium]
MDSLSQAPRPLAGRGLSFARLGLLLALAGLFGCQPASPAAPTPAATVPPTPTASPAPTATVPPTETAAPASPTLIPEAAWPRTLVDDEGTTIELAEPPQRVISLSPANTEIVFALGAGDRLVGGTDFDDYPPEAAALPDVATFTGVLHEAVAGLEPDLVLAAGNNFTPADDIEYMRDFGITVLVVYAETVDEVLADIELIGHALGEDEAAAEMVSEMEGRIGAVEAATAAIGERPRVLYQIGSVPEIYAPADDSFLADMVGLAGGEPITTGSPTAFSISVEQLVAQDPEVIVLGDAAYGVCPAEVAARPGWSGMTAVRDGAIRPVSDIIVTRPGPRLAEGLAALALAIHPEADIEPPADLLALCAEGRAVR